MAWILTKNKTNGSGESQIDTIKVNDVILIPDSDKAVNIEVPTNTNDLVNNSGFITNTVDNLLNYYLKTETYSKNEVNSLIDAVSSVTFEVVQALPSQDISVSTIYLVPKQDTETNDIYDEYIYVNNAWEKIGSTEMDLTNYVTTSDLNNALAAYTTSQNLNNLLNAKQDVLTPGNNINITNGVISATDTTYTSKSAVSGGTDVSLVTTGEKYNWNSKVDSSNLADVALSGNYNDLTNKPSLSDKQDKTDSGIKTTAKTVVGAINELLNKFTNYFAKTEVNEMVNPLKAHTRTNLLNPTAQTRTVNGVTCTNNGDGTYTLNGTATNVIYFSISDQFTDLDLTRQYKIVGCPHGGSENSYSLYDDKNASTGRDIGNGVVYKPTHQPRIYIQIARGTTCNNLVFKPMLTTDLSATYDDFVQYSGDGELNENVAEIYENQDNYENIVNLGEPYPTHLGVKNYIDSTGIFHQVLSRQYVKDMTWYYDSNYNAFYSYTPMNYVKHDVDNINVYMQGYTPDVNILRNTNSDKAILIGSSGRIWVRDTRYNTVASFTTALGNLKLFYELETPQTWNSKSEISRVSDETYTNLAITVPGTQTVNGITCTANSNGTFTINGTATARTFILISPNDESNRFKVGHRYKLTGCPSSGVRDKLALRFVQLDGSDMLRYDEDYGKGYIVTILPETTRIRFGILVDNGLTVNNLVFKPMITTKLDATYDDYIPYSGSGALNENVQKIYHRQRYVHISTNEISATYNPLTIAEEMLAERSSNDNPEIMYVGVANTSGYEQYAPSPYTTYEICRNFDVVTINTLGYSKGNFYTNCRSAGGNWIGWKRIMPTDTALDSSSINAIANGVVTTALNGKADSFSSLTTYYNANTDHTVTDNRRSAITYVYNTYILNGKRSTYNIRYAGGTYTAVTFCGSTSNPQCIETGYRGTSTTAHYINVWQLLSDGWNLYAPIQTKSDKNLTTTSKQIVGAINEINSDLANNYASLWTNPNPTSDFSPADLSIANLADYKAIVVIFKEYKTHSDYISQLVPVINGFSARLFVAGGDSRGYVQNSYRSLTIHTDTNKITFGNGGYNRVDTASYLANDQVIPYKILGVI